MFSMVRHIKGLTNRYSKGGYSHMEINLAVSLPQDDVLDMLRREVIILGEVKGF